MDIHENDMTPDLKRAFLGFLKFDPPDNWLAKTDVVVPFSDADRFIFIEQRFDCDGGFTDELYFEITTPCLFWKGWHDGKGHGKFSENGKGVYVHRRSLELQQGIKLGKLDIVDHRCRHPQCWNPDHLENVTTKINTDRGLGIHHQFMSKDQYAKIHGKH